MFSHSAKSHKILRSIEYADSILLPQPRQEITVKGFLSYALKMYKWVHRKTEAEDRLKDKNFLCERISNVLKTLYKMHKQLDLTLAIAFSKVK